MEDVARGLQGIRNVVLDAGGLITLAKSIIMAELLWSLGLLHASFPHKID